MTNAEFDPVLARGTGDFNPDLHPRGKDGKFIVKFGFVLATLREFVDGAPGSGPERQYRSRVVDITPDPSSPGNPVVRLEVFDRDGKVLGFSEARAKTLTAAETSKARLDDKSFVLGENVAGNSLRQSEELPVERMGATPRVTGLVPPPRTENPREGWGDVRVPDEDFVELESGTAGQYIVGRNPDGSPIFTPERQAMHDAVIAKWLSDPSTGGEIQPNASGQPEFHMLGGGPAAGKTTMTQSGDMDIPAHERGKGTLAAVLVNADEMKEEIPEYESMLEDGNPDAASLAHEESSYLAKRLQAAAIERDLDVVLDGTGNSKAASLRGKITAARDNGYVVHGYYATVPTDVAVERGMTRGRDRGRFVPEAVIRGTHVSVSSIFEEVAADFDTVVLYDTSEGARPLARMKRGDSDIEILDPAEYAAFIAKKDEDRGRRLASDKTGSLSRILNFREKSETFEGRVKAPQKLNDEAAVFAAIEDIDRQLASGPDLTPEEHKAAWIAAMDEQINQVVGEDLAETQLQDVYDAYYSGRLLQEPKSVGTQGEYIGLDGKRYRRENGVWTEAGSGGTGDFIPVEDPQAIKDAGLDTIAVEELDALPQGTASREISDIESSSELKDLSDIAVANGASPKALDRLRTAIRERLGRSSVPESEKDQVEKDILDSAVRDSASTRALLMQDTELGLELKRASKECKLPAEVFSPVPEVRLAAGLPIALVAASCSGPYGDGIADVARQRIAGIDQAIKNLETASGSGQVTPEEYSDRLRDLNDSRKALSDGLDAYDGGGGTSSQDPLVDTYFSNLTPTGVYSDAGNDPDAITDLIASRLYEETDLNGDDPRGLTQDDIDGFVGDEFDAYLSEADIEDYGELVESSDAAVEFLADEVARKIKEMSGEDRGLSPSENTYLSENPVVTEGQRGERADFTAGTVDEMFADAFGEEDLADMSDTDVIESIIDLVDEYNSSSSRRKKLGRPEDDQISVAEMANVMQGYVDEQSWDSYIQGLVEDGLVEWAPDDESDAGYVRDVDTPDSAPSAPSAPAGTVTDKTKAKTAADYMDEAYGKGTTKAQRAANPVPIVTDRTVGYDAKTFKWGDVDPDRKPLDEPNEFGGMSFVHSGASPVVVYRGETYMLTDDGEWHRLAGTNDESFSEVYIHPSDVKDTSADWGDPARGVPLADILTEALDKSKADSGKASAVTGRRVSPDNDSGTIVDDPNGDIVVSQGGKDYAFSKEQGFWYDVETGEEPDSFDVNYDELDAALTEDTSQVMNDLEYNITALEDALDNGASPEDISILREDIADLEKKVLAADPEAVLPSYPGLSEVADVKPRNEYDKKYDRLSDAVIQYEEREIRMSLGDTGWNALTVEEKRELVARGAMTGDSPERNLRLMRSERKAANAANAATDYSMEGLVDEGAAIASKFTPDYEAADSVYESLLDSGVMADFRDMRNSNEDAFVEKLQADYGLNTATANAVIDLMDGAETAKKSQVSADRNAAYSEILSKQKPYDQLKKGDVVLIYDPDNEGELIEFEVTGRKGGKPTGRTRPREEFGQNLANRMNLDLGKDELLDPADAGLFDLPLTKADSPSETVKAPATGVSSKLSTGADPRAWATTWVSAQELDDHIAGMEPEDRLKEFDFNQDRPRSPSLPSRAKKMSDDDLRATFDQIEASRASGTHDTSVDTERNLKIEMARRGLLTEADTKAASPSATKPSAKSWPTGTGDGVQSAYNLVLDKGATRQLALNSSTLSKDRVFVKDQFGASYVFTKSSDGKWRLSKSTGGAMGGPSPVTTGPADKVDASGIVVTDASVIESLEKAMTQTTGATGF